MLVLGHTNVALHDALASIPLPTLPNEAFSNTSVELAPAVFFSSAFIPTAAQRFGDFSAFSQPLINPMTGHAFPGNIIPEVYLFGDNGLFAFEVGPQTTVTPEPSAPSLILAGAFALGTLCVLRKCRALGPPSIQR
ncbi:MAG: hypothetical protein JO033_08295 [Acidobacteriaceae bacterium]|nr:hypothetical protein [Acidobacteriaceae bacterium]